LAGGGYKSGISEAIGLLTIWDTESGKERFTYSNPDGGIKCVAFSPDGRYLAAGGVGRDRVAKVWDISRRKIVTKLAHTQRELLEVLPDRYHHCNGQLR
jgi:WD40 repeat protein